MKTSFHIYCTCISVVLCLGICVASRAIANDNESAGPTAPASEAVELTIEAEQKILADQFAQLEEIFIRSAELQADANPARANLLQQAAQLSKQLALQQRLAVAVDYLNKGQFTRALQEQQAARDNLQKLLELLQRENRTERLRDDRERIEKMLKEVQRLSRLQRSLRGRTEAGQETSDAANEQQSLEGQVGELNKELSELNKADSTTESQSNAAKSEPAGNESEPSQPTTEDKATGDTTERPSDSQTKEGDDAQKPSNDGSNKTPDQAPMNGDAQSKDGAKENSTESQGSESQGSESQGSESQGSESQGSESQGSESQGSESQGSESQGSESQGSESQGSESQGSESPSNPGDGGEQPPPQPQSQEERAQQRVQQAQKRMQKAADELRKDQRKEAVEEQRAAEKELAEAIQEFEQILKQKREEEIERSLADLESRFRRMLTEQTQILSQTEKYAHAEGGIEQRQLEMQAIKLAIEERKVLIEGQRAMLLLEEEGSSMAFPEAVEQINGDLAIVIEMFNQNRMDDANLDLQRQVISTLEELIESLTATQEEKEKKKKEQEAQSGGQGPPPPQQDEALVDALAELRLIRTLQLRINKRTLSLAKQANKLEDPHGQVEDPLLSRQVRELAERQERIERVVRQLLIEQSRAN